MLKNKTIAVTIPCYNEETQITNVIETMPEFVDKIYIVDDKSPDATFEISTKLATNNPKIVVIQHTLNGGVGKAISTGYLAAIKDEIDITVVMAGDGQMDPLDLQSVIMPVVLGEVDYCKGNRFLYKDGIKKIPKTRFFGNFILSALTKIVSGYWHVSDSQTGYTAISLIALKGIAVEKIFPRYGCPNDILVKLNIADMRVGEVPVNPLYGVGEQSKMRIPRIIGPMLRLLAKLFLERMLYKYIIRTGHPLVFAYGLSALSLLSSITLFVYCAIVAIINFGIPKPSLIMAGITLILGIQFLLSAMEMDFSDNKDLNIRIRPS